MKYNLKYDINISFAIFFKINQHKIYPSYFFVQLFKKKMLPKFMKKFNHEHMA
jgi:hypothetical protein